MIGTRIGDIDVKEIARVQLTKENCSTEPKILQKELPTNKKCTDILYLASPLLVGP